MNEIITGGLAAFGLLIALGFGAFAVQSLREHERRAARLAFTLAGAGLFLLILALVLPVAAKLILLGLLVAAVFAGAALFLAPIGRVARGNDVPAVRVDERDIMFARARLLPGSPQYEAYYVAHPEHKTGDDATRGLPGLMSPDAKKAHPLHFAAADACFAVPAALREWVDGPVATAPKPYPADAITAYLKGLTRYFGARSVGVTELRPYHIYSHIGRGSGEWGAAITLDHRYAIAFTVEMDHVMVGAAPAAPEVLETAKQYSEAAQIAVQLAALIRSLGYPARAHIDGNYRVIAPLVARGRRAGRDRPDGAGDDARPRPARPPGRCNHRYAVGDGCPRG